MMAQKSQKPANGAFSMDTDEDSPDAREKQTVNAIASASASEAKWVSSTEGISQYINEESGEWNPRQRCGEEECATQHCRRLAGKKNEKDDLLKSS
jgi:hypothetical protein